MGWTTRITGGGGRFRGDGNWTRGASGLRAKPKLSAGAVVYLSVPTAITALSIAKAAAIINRLVMLP